MNESSLEHAPAQGRRQRRGLILLLVFTACMLPLLISLGFWQLGRAEDKTVILKEWAAREEAAPLQQDQLGEYRPDWRYRKVELSGHYRGQYQWLVDNRTYQGRPGYDVLTAFEPDNRQQAWILVNRGWVEASATRAELPVLPVPEEPQRLFGRLDNPSHNPLVLKELPHERGWPRRVQRVDIESLQTDLGRGLAPWMVRLDPDQAGALIPAHQPVTMGPDTHRGYAVQWFGLAFVLVVGVIAVLMQMRKERQ
jgi:surfeit locus 1 family protein